jgi:hypothetical protein
MEKLYPDRENLSQLYLIQRMSIPKIAELFDVNCWNIWHQLRKYGIKVRTRSEALYGNTIGMQHRDKISLAKQGKHCSVATEFTRENVLGEKNPFYGKRHSSETKQKISQSKKGMAVHSIGFKHKQQARMRKNWSNPTFRKKTMHQILKTLMEKPSKPEQYLIEIIENNSLPFSYVGDGKELVGNLCPDFIHKDGEKKIIEVFGRVFHDPDFSFRDEIPWHQQYWGRIAYYAQLGYNCLVLWDDELNNEEVIIERIRGFVDA